MNYLFNNNTQTGAKKIVVSKKTTSYPDEICYMCSSYTSDTACIQAAIDAATDGATLIFLPGNYSITSRITCSSKNITLISDGNANFTFSATTSDDATLAFSGTQVATPTLASDAAKGAVTISVADATSIQAGDLIKIYKDVKWSPSDYASQQTGEMYEIVGVSGTTLSLNQPLLRAYAVSETVSIQIYRAPEIHISGLKIQDAGSTTSHAAISLTRCKNSSVDNCTILDSGLYGLGFYSCYNVRAQRNTIKNCLLAGSGYGISVWNATAYADISHNHIENCRHCVTANASEYLALIRDITIDNNTLIGGNITGANVIDAHAVTYSYYVTNNKIFIRGGYLFAFFDGAQISRFSGNEIYTGYGAVARRGVVPGGYHIYENNKMTGCNGPFYQAGSSASGDTIVIRNNDMDDGEYGIDFRSAEVFSNYIIENNNFNGLSYPAVYLGALPNNCYVKVSNNKFKDLNRQGIYIVGTSGETHDVTVSDNDIINNNISNGSYAGIYGTDLVRCTFRNNKIFDHNAKNGSAILLSTGCDNNTIIGNEAYGMTGTKFSAAGTNREDNYSLT